MSYKVKVDHFTCTAAGGHVVTSRPGALAGFVMVTTTGDPTFAFYNGGEANTGLDNEIYPTDIHDASAHAHPYHFLPGFLIPAPDGLYLDVSVMGEGVNEYTIYYVEDD